MLINQAKLCKRCNTEKSLNEFRMKGKYCSSDCRECERDYQRDYRENNPEKVKAKAKKHYEHNKEKLLSDSREYRKNNPEKRREATKKSYYKNIEENRKKGRIKAKKWRDANREKYLASKKRTYKKHREQYIAYSKEWGLQNKDKIKQYKIDEYQRNKIKLQFRLNGLMSGRMRDSLKAGSNSKNGRHWEDLVPYNVQQLKEHLKFTMPEGYTWDDYMNGELHIDHIIPISVFNFSSPEHIDFKRCWALDNLQLLLAKENLVKNNRLEQSFQPSLAL